MLKRLHKKLRFFAGFASRKWRLAPQSVAALFQITSVCDAPRVPPSNLL